MDWQDISTAPKDGTVILLSKGDEVHPGAWCPSEVGDDLYPWLFWHRLNASQVKPNGWQERAPTHWMPLPAPPLPTEKEG